MTVDVDPLQIGLFFGVLILGYVFAGSIDARLQTRHPETHAKLGTMIDSDPLNRDSAPRALRWLLFLAVGHFQLGDGLLSALCVSNLILGGSVVAYLLGAW